jgi:maleate isomerase
MARTGTRLGVLVPSGNVVLEPDMYRMAPPGVTVHFSRVVNSEDTPEQLLRMIDYVPRCCEELSHANMDAYAFGCTAGSLMGGVGYDRKISDLMESLTKKPSTTTSSSVLAGLRELGIQRVSVLTPYEDWLNDLEKTFFEGHGLTVCAIRGLGFPDPEDIAGTTPDQIVDLVRSVDRPEAQGIFLSCTDFRAVEALERLERELGKPAVSSNQATMWSLLRLAGVRQPVRGFGTLLTRL